ncbi:cytochrome c biogenesis protein CcdA [Feifania hominis]|uniref:Redoxin domain-containing protein n=1 Tax=Feifania hominis TaxID=2763660 RepID=A0A926DDH6_9FIRM|nr:cytochrome c biogenesis protein CcdA [Feifania hominis]MBC8535842.1 redoxin domain-containing protein [Feifania hominis]
MTLQTGVSALTVFFQGLLSFFSPCVLPLVPLYIGYLAGGAKTVGEDGEIRYRRATVIRNTAFFVLGVSFAFFALGFGFTAAGRFFSGNRALFARIGGVVVILFGAFQLFSDRPMGREHRLPFNLSRFSMNPLVALVLGFTFSFAWTPCVGPALASVLLMAGSAASSAAGYALIGVYTLGFVLPFLAVGLFTGTLLSFFRRHRNVVRYTVKAGGILMIAMGVMMFTGWMNGITSYLSGFGAPNPPASTSQSGQTENGGKEEQTGRDPAPETEPDAIAAPDFTLTDQNGVSHTLSDYRGQVVFLNFWATWCPPCQNEMPHIQQLYEKYEENSGEVVVLGVANPRDEEHPHNNDKTAEEVADFLEAGGYTFPTVMDTTGDVLAAYGIGSFPTTFMIDAEGNVFGYVPGGMTADMIQSVVDQTLAAGE